MSAVFENKEDTSSESGGEMTVVKTKPVMFFGRDLTQVPCFRRSFIFGICSGVAAGLFCFLCTSKIRLSTHVSFGSMCTGVLLYWFPCRHMYETSLGTMSNAPLIHVMQKHAGSQDE